MTSVLVACAICFGQSDPRMTMLLMGMLALPFTIVGFMMGLLYVKGVFATEPVSDDGDPSEPAAA
ncbi:MAG: hypothetical protein ABEK50_01180 [bacterium]